MTAPGNVDSFKRAKILAHPLLGQVTDNQVALDLGVGHHLVSKVRDAAGIESYTLRRRRVAKEMAELVAQSDLVGKYADREVAEHLGVPYTYVRLGRNARGLPRTDEPLPDPKNALLRNWAPPKPAIGRTRNEWRSYVQQLA